MKALHDLPINADKLLDQNEEDSTARMIKSLLIDDEPFKELHLEDTENRQDIIKARILMRKCFEESSKVIQEKIKKKDLKN